MRPRRPGPGRARSFPRPDPPDQPNSSTRWGQTRRIRLTAMALLVLGLLVPLALPMLWGGGRDAAVATGRGLAYLVGAGAACYWVTRSTGPRARATSLLMLAGAWLAWTGYHTLVDFQRAAGGS